MEPPICDHCGEPILPTDPHHPSIKMHRECLTRHVMGSIAHLQAGEHQVGSCDGDPPGITKREAAKQVLDFIMARHNRDN